MPELEDKTPFEKQYPQYSSVEEEQEEETHATHKTDVARPATPWDNLPYGWRTRSQEAFLQQKHKSQLTHAQQQDKHY